MHFAENFCDSLVAALVHRKALSVPVTRRTQLLELADNAPAILFFPVPRALKEFLPAKVMLVDAFLFQLLNDLNLRGNACMVCPRLPERIVSLHSLKADQDILHRVIQRMSHMKLPCNIWRRNHNRKRFLTPVSLRMKIFLIKPLLVNPVLQTMWVISLCQLLAHKVLLSNLSFLKITLMNYFCHCAAEQGTIFPLLM